MRVSVQMYPKGQLDAGSALELHVFRHFVSPLSERQVLPGAHFALSQPTLGVESDDDDPHAASATPLSSARAVRERRVAKVIVEGASMGAPITAELRITQARRSAWLRGLSVASNISGDERSHFSLPIPLAGAARKGSYRRLFRHRESTARIATARKLPARIAGKEMGGLTDRLEGRKKYLRGP